MWHWQGAVDLVGHGAVAFRNSFRTPTSHSERQAKVWLNLIQIKFILVLHNIYKAGFLPSYTSVLFANAMLQYNSSSTNIVSEMEL